jgi:predicted ATPase
MSGHAAVTRFASLPESRNSTIGRDREIAATVRALLGGSARLTTLTGFGGIGKTRIAIEAGHATASTFPDRAAFVPLAGIGDPALVLPAIATALGIRDNAHESVVEWLSVTLSSRRLLLILDSFEHVMEAASDLLAVIERCPGVAVLITSRVPLRVHGEHEILVPPLRIPTLAEVADPKALAANPSVALFLDRAQATRTHIVLTDDNAGTIAAICTRLDGVPLALELAAARVTVLSPQALLARLTNRLAILTGGARDAPPRLRTMRDAIAWSDDLLPPEAQAAFRQLAIFVNGWTLDAAEAICDVHAPILDQLSILIEHSLVHKSDRPDGESRFNMLDTVREYALEQLHMSDEFDALGQRHLTWFLALSEQASESNLTLQQTQLGLLRDDIANLYAALALALRTGQHESGMRLAASLMALWMLEGTVDEGPAMADTVPRGPSQPGGRAAGAARHTDQRADSGAESGRYRGSGIARSGEPGACRAPW